MEKSLSTKMHISQSLQLIDLPIEILVRQTRIFLALDNPMDIITCESVCKYLRNVIQNQIWKTMHSLTRRIRTTGAMLDITHFQQVFARCAFNLRVLDLSELSPSECHYSFKCSGQIPNVTRFLSIRLTNGYNELEELDISGVQLTSGRQMVELARLTGRKLRRLSIRSCFLWNEETQNDVVLKQSEIDEFFGHLPHLTEFDMSNNNMSTFNCLPFTYINPGLQKFNSLGTHLNGNQLMSIASRCSNLRTFNFRLVPKDLSGDHSFTKQNQLDNVLQSLTKLEDLQIEKNPSLKGYMTLKESTLCRSLHSLNITHLCADDEFASGLFNADGHSSISQHHRFEKLLDFTLKGGLFPPKALVNFFRKLTPNITRLTLWRCENVSDKALQIVASHGKLQELHIFMCKNVSDLGFMYALESCKDIRLFRGWEQLTDSLLTAVENTMEHQLGEWPEELPLTNISRFRFIRMSMIMDEHEEHQFGMSPEDMNYYTYSELHLASAISALTNPNCQQTFSQNMHPWILFR
ncbi:hypothetical protein Ddc_07609 [Ditylenchus destructor]|nr:hypothetical protein Ddc_07609 [Ditylenchus destructor]